MLIERLDRLATGRNVIITLVAALSLLLAANVFSSHFYVETGGYGLLDLAGERNALTFQKPYTPEDACALLIHWGATGRHDQLVFTLTLDALGPPATWLFLALALLYVTRPIRGRALAPPLCGVTSNRLLDLRLWREPGNPDPSLKLSESARWCRGGCRSAVDGQDIDLGHRRVRRTAGLDHPTRHR